MYWILSDMIIVNFVEYGYGIVVIYFLKFLTFNLEQISLFFSKQGVGFLYFLCI